MQNNGAIAYKLDPLNPVPSSTKTQLCPDVSSLTRLITRGSQTAFEIFYDEYSPRVFKLLIVITRGDQSLASDLHQRVMIKAATKMRLLESEDQLWRWLAQIARNAWRDSLRARMREDRARETLLHSAAAPAPFENFDEM